eukprot:GHVQ01027035.1.p1 GENE.GHVQ01027035.1~~GHVQ01027035.1.p1  ORF type:complete len:121 (-),score=14.80 GHVQ01027035.1:95-457(-)
MCGQVSVSYHPVSGLHIPLPSHSTYKTQQTNKLSNSLHFLKSECTTVKHVCLPHKISVCVFCSRHLSLLASPWNSHKVRACLFDHIGMTIIVSESLGCDTVQLGTCCMSVLSTTVGSDPC